MAKRDYYEVLGVGRQAGNDEIKAAYRKLAKKHHPDLNSGDKESEAKLKEINEAYEVLSDDSKRQQYDQFGHQDPGMGGGGAYGGFSGFGGFEDLFGSIFGGFGGQARTQTGPVAGDDIRADVTLTLSEAFTGVRKTINYTHMVGCGECSGTGAAKGTQVETCRECNGSGQKTVIQNTILGKMRSSMPCGACKATGKIISTPCPTCHGNGRMRKHETLEVAVPAGIDNGQRIPYRGYGDSGQRGGPNGDLYVYISVKPHKIFSRKAQDLYCEIPITFVQAALGSEIDVPTLEGPFKHTLKEGTQPGDVLHIPQKGMPVIGAGSRKGTLHVTLQVEIPTKLSDQQRAILQQFDGISAGSYARRKGFLDKLKDFLDG